MDTLLSFCFVAFFPRTFRFDSSTSVFFFFLSSLFYSLCRSLVSIPFATCSALLCVCASKIFSYVPLALAGVCVLIGYFDVMGFYTIFFSFVGR